jgi:hypothetical protein
MIQLVKDRTIADQAITVAKFLHLSQCMFDGLEVSDLFLDFMKLGIDAMHNIYATFLFIPPQLKELFDFGQGEAECLRPSDKAEAIFGRRGVSTMPYLGTGRGL